MTQKELELFVVEEGATACAGCELGSSPIKGQEELRYAFSIVMKLSDSILKTVDGAPTFAYFQHYRAANALLDQIAFKLASKIEKAGYKAFPVAASQSQGKERPYEGVVSHKISATKSGLGFVGKSGLFLSKDYGSKVRLATVLTDMPLTAELPIIENGCGDCKICMQACPAGAIFGERPVWGERNIDPEKCSKYMKEHFQEIGRGSVCGICIKVCPKNKL